MRKLTFKPVLQRLLDDPDQFLEKIRTDADAFTHAVLREEGEPSPPSGLIPTLDSIAIAVFAGDGSVVHERRPDWWSEDLAFEELRDQAGLPLVPPRIAFLRGGAGRQLRGIMAPGAEATEWNLPYETRDALARHGKSSVLLCVDSSATSRALRQAARSFGLTGLQERVVLGAVGHGSARAAADVLGLSYATVREALSEAAKRMRAPNLPALVRRVVETSFGILPSNLDSAADMAGMLPLTPRQCQICELVAEGVGRQGTAEAMRISPAVVKKELEQIFALLGVSSAAGLARTWVEAKALRYLARRTDSPLGFFDPLVEPTHFLPRTDDRQIIAWSDYGPASGKPVLLVHSNWTCRAVPRPMVMRLQAAGWRPIAIDRPGFGSTHPGTLSAERPYDQAIVDTLDVLNRLRMTGSR